MSEWLVEDGIGETRAALVEKGRIVAARIELPGGTKPGLVTAAQLLRKVADGRRGIVALASGGEAMLSAVPKKLCEGESLTVTVVREAMHEIGRDKLPLVRATDEAPRAAPTLAERLAEGDVPVRKLDAHSPDELSELGWHEVIEQAATGLVPFDGGSLVIALTAAMTLIDVDGDLAPRPLSLAAAPAIANAIRLFGIEGSIGVDFPTIEEKLARRLVDDALEATLSGSFERTAMNGFGFVQIVTRRERRSLIAIVQDDVVAVSARALMRSAERVRDPGTLLLTAPPTVRAACPVSWTDQLQTRTGRMLRWAIDDAVTPGAANAQAVAA